MILSYEVITKTDPGDKATALGYGLARDGGMDPVTYEHRYEPLDPMTQLSLMIDVFQAGRPYRTRCQDDDR